MRPGSGYRPNGRCAQSLRRRRRAAWERRSPMRGGTRFSPWLESLARTISMRRTLARAATPIRDPVWMFKHRRSLVADEPPFAPSGASRKDKVIRAPRIVLATDQSETVRDRLVAEISDLKSADEATDWVRKNLPAKNTLADVDAEIVEASFRERLATL